MHPVKNVATIPHHIPLHQRSVLLQFIPSHHQLLSSARLTTVHSVVSAEGVPTTAHLVPSVVISIITDLMKSAAEAG